MSIATTESKITYQGNGATYSWPFSFPVLEASHLQIILTDNGGAETILTENFRVDMETKEVVYPVCKYGETPSATSSPPVLPSGSKLTIRRVLPLTQETDLGDRWPFSTIEASFDRVTMQIQQLAEELERSVKVGVASSATPDELIASLRESAAAAINASVTAVTSANTATVAQEACSAAKEVCEAGASAVENAASIATTAALQALQDALNSKAFARIVPVGVPFPWFSSTYPAGTLLCNGQSFSATNYPELAEKYPSLTLPDLRGVVPRGLDRGRGLDTSTRDLGSYQADAFQGHKHIFGAGGSASGDPLHSCSGAYAMPWNYSDGSYPQSNYVSTVSDGANGTPRTAAETRMKNIACDWLVYASTPTVELNNGGGT